MTRARRPRNRDGIIAGYVLKLARESTEWTQTEMARHLSVEPHTIHSWETGRRSLAHTNVRELLELRLKLIKLGVQAELIDSLHPALEADYILSQTMGMETDRIDVQSHPLANWLLPHTVSEMLAWPLTGAVPSAIATAIPRIRRRGPVAAGPELSGFERARFFQNLSAAADLIAHDRSDLDDSQDLLSHQLYLRIGWDREAHTADSLRRLYADHLQSFPTFKRWSPRWLERRSLVIALACRGDLEPMQRFIQTAHHSDECEMANLNYWAYWSGELHGARRSQGFMISTQALRSWTGATLLPRLTRKLTFMNPYLELNIHSILKLLDRPVTMQILDGDATLASTLRSRVAHLLDQRAQLSAVANSELERIHRAVIGKGVHSS